MSETLIIDALEQLKPFLNDKKVLEIVVRGKNKRIQAFQKIALNDLPNEAKEAAAKAMQALNENSLLMQKNMNMIQKVAMVQNLGLVLKGILQQIKTPLFYQFSLCFRC